MKMSNISKVALLAALASSNSVFAAKRSADQIEGLMPDPVAKRLTQEAQPSALPEVTLISSDEESFEVPTEFAMQSGTLQHMIEDCEDPNQTVTLPNVASATMQNLIPCLEIISMGNGNKDVIKTELSKFINTQDLSQQALEDLLLAANFLDIQQIIDAVTVLYDSMRSIVPFIGTYNKFVQKLPAASDSEEIEELKLLARNLTNIICYSRQLTSLSLAGDEVTDARLQALAPHLQGLTSFMLSLCRNITDAGLKALAPHLQGLTRLVLSSDNITHAGLQVLAPHLQGLTRLVLSSDNITDAGLQVLAPHLQALTELSLCYCCEITHAGLQALAPHLKALTTLDVLGCPRVSKAVLKELQDLIKNRRSSLVERCSDCIGAQALSEDFEQ